MHESYETSQVELKQIWECGLADICWAHAMLVKADNAHAPRVILCIMHLC